MSFLQPWMLAALPLIALPVIIHLINQRRYQSTRWAAMMFLLAANRMSRGYARLRQWLILLFRVAVIAGLVLAVSRPLSSGWFGLTAGSRSETTLVLLDRSPSMQQHDAGTNLSKLSRAAGQLVETLRTLGASRWGVIDSARTEPQEMEAIESLSELSAVAPSGSSADLPAMLSAARDYIRANRPGSTDIWMASDLQVADWNPDSPRWQTLRDDFQSLPQGVRFHLLAFPETAPDNIAVRVTDARRVESSEGAELRLSLQLTRHGESDVRQEVPVVIEIEGTRSVVPMELIGSRAELQDHRIALPRGQQRGWGVVSLPADSNPADNEFYFVFDEPSPRHTVIVAERAEVAELMQLAATASPDPQVTATAEIASRAQVAAVPWEEVSLLLWHGQLPEGEAADEVETFLARGGQAIFFPTANAAESRFLGVQWQRWINDAESERIETWRADQDLLTNTASGAALPVGQIELRQRMTMSGDFTPLATLGGGDALLGRVLQGRGTAYFCATTPMAEHSSLAADGVVFYVMVQRALRAGSEALGHTHQVSAGKQALRSGAARTADDAAEMDEETGEGMTNAVDKTAAWQPLVGAEEVLSSEYPYQPGVYADGERLVAVNRPVEEDDPARVQDDRLESLFGDLDFIRFDAAAGRDGGLVQEVWRLFVIAMISAMIIEAGLSLPRRQTVAQAASL